MKFTDIFIRRPVLASVVSLMILVVGIRAGTTLQVLQYPRTENAVVTIATTHEAGPLMTEGTQFWVVKPRFFAGNISGIETLLSGSYVGMLPPASGGAPKRDFIGLEDPPVLESDVPGRTFLMRADRLGSISLGSPIFYRDLSVGCAFEARVAARAGRIQPAVVDDDDGAVERSPDVVGRPDVRLHIFVRRLATVE